MKNARLGDRDGTILRHNTSCSVLVRFAWSTERRPLSAVGADDRGGDQDGGPIRGEALSSPWVLTTRASSIS
jgi:hypothetical protein